MPSMLRGALSVGCTLAAAWLCGCQPAVFDKLMGSQQRHDSGLDTKQAGASTRQDAGMPQHAMDSGAHMQTGRGVDAGGSTSIIPPKTQPTAGKPAAHPMDAGKPMLEAGPAMMEAGPRLEAGPGDAGDAGDAGGEKCPAVADPSKLKLSISDLGVVTTPSWAHNRYASGATLVGDKVLWVFTLGDEHMVAWGTPADLRRTPPHFDEHAPLTSLFAPPDNKLVLGKGVVPWNDRAALLVVGFPTGWAAANGTGLARLDVGAAQATVVRAPDQLLSPRPSEDGGTMNAWLPAFTSSALSVQEGTSNFIYLYACQPNPDVPAEANTSPCRIARVHRLNVDQGDAYTFWNGRNWVADVRRAAVVIDQVQLGLSVAYHRYLGKFLAVVGLAPSRVQFRWADQPQGPWQVIGEFTTRESDIGFGTTFAMLQHPYLTQGCEPLVYISYVRPYDTGAKDDAGNTVGKADNILLRVELY